MDDLKSIYLEAGKTPLSFAGPYSVDEIDLMLDKIDPGTLSPAGRRAYDEIRSNLVTWSPKEPMALHFALHPEAALQGYLHTNTDRSTTISGNPPGATACPFSPSPWSAGLGMRPTPR